jgi:hypothetical protein
LQRKKEEGKSVHRDCASPAFSISYGQAKEMATHNGSHLSNVSSKNPFIGKQLLSSKVSQDIHRN